MTRKSPAAILVHRESILRTPAEVPTLAQLVREGQVSAARIKRATKDALVEWFAQSERLNIARQHHGLRGDRFIDLAGRIGVDRASAYQLVKLWQHRTPILARCLDEGRYYGWETCLYWFERAPRKWNRTWNRKNAATNAQMAELICNHMTKLMLLTLGSSIWCRHPHQVIRQDRRIRRTDPVVSHASRFSFAASGTSAMVRRCDSSSIVVGLIDPEFRQLAADTTSATKHGNDKSALCFGDWHIGADVGDHPRTVPLGPGRRRRSRDLLVSGSSTSPMSAPEQVIRSGIVRGMGSRQTVPAIA